MLLLRIAVFLVENLSHFLEQHEVQNSIPDHDSHTSDIASVSPLFQASKTIIIQCIFLNYMPLFGTILLKLHTVWTHCSVAVLPPTHLPLCFTSSCLCSFEILFIQSDSSWSFESFTTASLSVSLPILPLYLHHNQH